mmetsp:Transcript_19012/g.36576  ORF Transcript_19012/g.36576 Transcript_19012/m.36576 type:complete len:703 (+) Transcript_19012:60-2168(+)
MGSTAEEAKRKTNLPLGARQIASIRCLAADIVEKAGSGHPGAPMGMAAMAHVLWGETMKYSPKNPQWMARDRFVMSNGHSCALQYIMLYLTGYDSVGLQDLRKLRQFESYTPGHPERHATEGIEVSTGPLGQGISNAVGLAIAESHLAAVYNKPGFELFDNYTFVLTGDGCMQEGVASEACSLAGHLGLGKLIVLYDDNQITIGGSTNVSFTEDVGKRFEAYGWQVIEVGDAISDVASIKAAITLAKQDTKRPSFIKCKTIIGYGSKKQGTGGVHGSPLGSEDLKMVKEKFGFDGGSVGDFEPPKDVLDAYRSKIKEGEALEKQWQETLSSYAEKYPKEAKEIKRRFAGKLPEGWSDVIPSYKPTDKGAATRNLSGVVLNKLAPILPELVGGSADLTPSNKTALECTVDYQKDARQGRYYRFGVREHGMMAVGNGIHAYGGMLPFTATFLVFLEYGFPSARLSALSGHKHLFVMTHDSIYVGGDGPTHQPIEHAALCRATPNLLFFRPADGNEVGGAYKMALMQDLTPSVLALSRQKVPQLEGTSIDSVAKGGYTVKEHKDAELILIGTGSEVSLCLKAAELLPYKTSVVSMPCTKLFDEQSLEYRRSVLPMGVPIVSVEAMATTGWYKYAHYAIGMTTFGASGPGEQVAEFFGFTPEKVAKKVAEWMDTVYKPVAGKHGLGLACQMDLPTKRDLHYLHYKH